MALCIGLSASAAGESNRRLEMSLGPEVNVGAFLDTPPINQYQTNLRTDPNNADQMVITAKNGKEQHTVAFHTNDGGKSWSVTRTLNSSDPDVVFDNRGNAYWTYIKGSGAKRTCEVRRSFDGGKTWQDPQALIAQPPAVDHPHVTVDRSEKSPHYGSIYFAGRQFYAAKLQVVRSRDAGETWTTQVVDLPEQVGQGFVHQTAVTRDGTLVVPVESKNQILTENERYAGSKRNLYIMTSNDGGVSFNEPVYIGNKDSPVNAGPGSYRSNSGVAVGPYKGGERLYYVFPKPLQKQPAELQLVVSDDNGKTWSDPTPILPPTPDGWGQGAASVMTNTEGVLGVSYYSEAHSPARFDVYFTASIDGGETFTDPLRVTSVTSAVPAVGTQPRELGGDQVYSDAAADGSFRIVWTDNRDGDDTYQTYFRTVKVTVLPEP